MLKETIMLASVAVGLCAADLPSGYKLLHEETFDSASATNTFTMTDPAAWSHSKEGREGGALELVKQSRYAPPVRSPVNIALITEKVFGDFVLEADLVQTGREYGHRDMCLFFGFQRPGQFYYAHIASKADPNAHNIFRVNDLPRTNIAQRTASGVNWGLGVWHKVRLERSVSSGSIKVYFDDLKEPIMIAEDKTFGAGRIGFGSFDDTGKIDNVRIWGPSLGQPRPPIKFDAKP